jgi:hypothetical protein
MLAVAAVACNLPMFAPSTPPAAATLGWLYTQAAQTLQASQAQGGTPTATPSPTGASPTLPAAISTRTPGASALCDAAAFVRDVTIPDNAVVQPGADFTKTWRLQNAGTCSWTPAYALVFVTGDRMRGAAFVDLPGNVNPGESIDVSVKLSAPASNGEYQGYWRLRNASGARFGIGPQGDGAFWVKVRIAGSTFSAYDFARRYCDATWQNNNRELPCPGNQGDSKGYVIQTEDVVLENGNTQNDPALLTAPKDSYNGSITGEYPAIKVRQGDYFQARVNCAYKAYSCNVIFSLYYQIGSGSIKSLGHWTEAYEGRFYPIDLDLSDLAGSNVKFILSVSTNGPFNQDQAIWVGPRIARLGLAPNTATPTATTTATLTATASATPTPTWTPTPSPTPTETPTSTPTP